MKTVTITFDELPEGPVDGISINGVTFSYNGTFSNYRGVSGPPSAQFLASPYLDGHTDGTLTLDFTDPTPILEFGLSYRNADSFPEAASVELFDVALQSMGSFTVSTTPLVVFTEGQFSHNGESVKRAIITFDDSINAFFHLDNLTFKSKHGKK